MSIQFSDTSTKKGLIQVIERRLFPQNDAYISGNTQRLKEWTADINIAFDEILSNIFEADGRWQFDDSNHTKYPTIKTNLVSGQRDYAFTTDEQSNLILDIYKVMVLPSATGTLFQEIYPFDAQSKGDDDISTENSATGAPYQYDKQANAVFLDPAPNYNATNGLKIFINREANYFTTTDTTKMAGFAGLYHELLALIPMSKYASDHTMPQLAKLELEKIRMLDNLIAHYSKRSKDEIQSLSGQPIIYE